MVVVAVLFDSFAAITTVPIISAWRLVASPRRGLWHPGLFTGASSERRPTSLQISNVKYSLKSSCRVGQLFAR
jgi:hypothetical protein